jgi:hypothetical protein
VFNKGFSQFDKYWVIRQVSVIFMSNSIRGAANSKMYGQKISPLGYDEGFILILFNPLVVFR